MYDRLYIEYLYYFNEQRDYYECHEVMEELWLQEGKNKLLQALLQVAVGLYHFRNENLQGAIKLMEQALDKCSEKWHGSLGIDEQKLFAEVREYLDRLNQYEQHPFEFHDLTIQIQDPELKRLVKDCLPEGVAEEDKF